MQHIKKMDSIAQSYVWNIYTQINTKFNYYHDRSFAGHRRPGYDREHVAAVKGRATPMASINEKTTSAAFIWTQQECVCDSNKGPGSVGALVLLS